MTTKPPIVLDASFLGEERLLETPVSRFLGSTMFWVLCGLLIFGPLAFGAVEAWSTAALQAASVLLLFLWCLRQFLIGAVIIQGSPLFLPISAFAAVVIAQLIFRTTTYSYVTVVEAMNYFCFALLIFLAAQTIHSEKEFKTFALVLIAFGFALSLFAIVQGLTSNGMLYWVRHPRFNSPFYGPYVNRNHYAGLMEMLTPFALVLSFSKRHRAGLRLLLGFAGLIMSASIFLSGSRGGASAFVAEVIFLFLISRGIEKGKGLRWSMAIFFLLLVAFLFWIDVSAALSRWSLVKEGLEVGRLAIARDCLRMFAQRPILGWGLGSFPVVYPQFRSFYTDYFINEAHNDFLQILVETGVVGALAMVWFIVSLYRSSLHRLRTSRSDQRSAIRLAAITGCTGLLVHSLVDFNLHIPANAAMFFVLCAVAASQRRKTSDLA